MMPPTQVSFQLILTSGRTRKMITKISVKTTTEMIRSMIWAAGPLPRNTTAMVEVTITVAKSTIPIAMTISSDRKSLIEPADQDAAFPADVENGVERVLQLPEHTRGRQ